MPQPVSVASIIKNCGKRWAKSSFTLRHCQGEHGWCGTIPLNGDSNTVARPTVDSGWGYCTDDCKGDYSPNQHLSILLSWCHMERGQAANNRS